MSHAIDKSACKAETKNMQMMAKAGSRIRWHVNAGHRVCASPLNAIAGSPHLLRVLKTCAVSFEHVYGNVRCLLENHHLLIPPLSTRTYS
jgi:pyridoxine 5'-phosphate synthase PdxJ